MGILTPQFCQQQRSRKPARCCWNMSMACSRSRPIGPHHPTGSLSKWMLLICSIEWSGKTDVAHETTSAIFTFLTESSSSYMLLPQWAELNTPSFTWDIQGTAWGLLGPVPPLQGRLSPRDLTRSLRTNAAPIAFGIVNFLSTNWILIFKMLHRDKDARCKICQINCSFTGWDWVTW